MYSTDKELLIKAAAGDSTSAQKLVEDNYGLVLSIVKRFQNRGVEKEDLIQIGSIGLIKAVQNFNTEYGVMFSTYAVPMIAGEIKRFLRDDGPVKVSRSLKELNGKARAAQAELTVLLKREPTLAEIAKHLEVSAEDLTLAMEAAQSPESFYRKNDGEDAYLLDKLVGQQPSEFDGILDKMTVGSLMDTLTDEERTVIRMRYYGGKTQQQVGQVLGISQVQVSRKEKKALDKMRRHL